ncbi:MAG: hypothetical protein ACRDBO_03985 [Lachnospiraceae bacterium]
MVYIASPFRGDYEKNLANAITYCKIASALNVLPVAPHIMFSGWCRDTIPEERELGLKLGLELLKQSKELWVMGKEHSEGMKGEIQYAREQGIPTYYISEPENENGYPISKDGNALLCQNDCAEEFANYDISGMYVVLPHHCLKPEYRTPINQIWSVTHGPGCHPGAFSDTIHLCHPIDKDVMVVGRHELYGIASAKTMENITRLYPDMPVYRDWQCTAEGELAR